MNMETLYATLAGSVSFVLIAYGSFWYFSPAKPPGSPVTEGGSAPAKAVVAIPTDTIEPAPVVVRPAATDNGSPLPASPTSPAPPTPTAYGSAIGAGSEKIAPSLQEDDPGLRRRRARPKRMRSRTDDE